MINFDLSLPDDDEWIKNAMTVNGPGSDDLHNDMKALALQHLSAPLASDSAPAEVLGLLGLPECAVKRQEQDAPVTESAACTPGEEVTVRDMGMPYKGICYEDNGWTWKACCDSSATPTGGTYTFTTAEGEGKVYLPRCEM